MQFRLSVLTQTPLVRFLRDVPATPRPALSSFREGEDYARSPGGVTRMVDPLLRRLLATGRVASATWTSLARYGPPEVDLADRMRLRLARLPETDLRAYAEAKARVWDAIHGLGSRDLDRLPEGLAALSRAFADATAREHAAAPFDVFYAHDFQLLPLGDLLPRGPPRIFRWHVPVPDATHPILPAVVAAMNAYDAVIVSTEAYAMRLRRAGVAVPIHVRYPHLDESRRRIVTADDVAGLEARLGIAPRDIVFLVVARMDPMKSQDVAIRAMPRVLREAPHARLVLVGGGGFSAGKTGGLGLSYAETWRAKLERLARDLGVAHRVTFAGALRDKDLDVAFTRARAVLLPSRLEGFGLAAVEGWLYGRPVVASRGAGVAELVEEGANGFTHAADDDAALASAMTRLASDAALAARLGEAGRETARACHLGPAVERIGAILEQATVRAGGR